MICEINFDGIIGPSHNYAGLSPGNLASAHHAGRTAHPRAAALQGVEKMRHNLHLGLAQGFFMPLDRPHESWLAMLGCTSQSAELHLRAQAMSASAMWAANAATVSPAADTGDGRCHITIANLLTMPHRSHEWPGTLAQLQLAFAHAAFAVHPPIPAPFGDEGAANHMRLCRDHADPGVEIFVYGLSGGTFPARQNLEASKAIARRHRLSPARTLFLRQSDAAIAAGAFHNDVVAVANQHILLTHEQAFHTKEQAYDRIRSAFPAVEIIEIPASALSLADAIASYIFNAQLISLPQGGMALVLPTEAMNNQAARHWLEAHVRTNGPITQLLPVDVRQSMANGGGPACLRLRVIANPETIDQRFLLDERKLVITAEAISRYWPEAIAPADVGDEVLASQCLDARARLLEALDLSELVPDSR